jgi:putative hydrolase
MKNQYTIEADTHCHTSASVHAYGSISENIDAAAILGLKALAITDHGPALPDSPHFWHFTNMRVLPRQVKGVTLLRGIEANILDPDGTLDLEEETLDNLDWVIASFHKQSFLVSTPAIHTQALIQTAANPRVDLFGHLDAPEYPFDIKEVVKACKENGKFIEMNDSSSRIRTGGEEMCRQIALECMNQGVFIVMNSDAHCPWDIGRIKTSAALLASISFPIELLLNHYAKDVIAHIERKKNRKIQ